jgi:hypothetical protein
MRIGGNMKEIKLTYKSSVWSEGSGEVKEVNRIWVNIETVDKTYISIPCEEVIFKADHELVDKEWMKQFSKVKKDPKTLKDPIWPIKI